MDFSLNILQLDPQSETERICSFIRDETVSMRRAGAVVGLSGGVDSAFAATLCVRALEPEKVLGLILPERESNPVSAEYAAKQAWKLKIRTETVDITPVLEAFRAYGKRDEAIKAVIPEFGPGWKSKIALPADLLGRDALNFFTLKVCDKQGNLKTTRLRNEDVRRIVAATDTKQRTRMMQLYYYAERDNYLVCGTTNRSETVQGFFVKYGDGGVDIEPIAHLYKSQVYQMARYLGVITEIIKRPPSPDTFSFVVTDEEFYLRMPYEALDLLLYAWENEVPLSEVSQVMALREEQVERAFRDFSSKFGATRHLRCLPTTLEAQPASHSPASPVPT